MNLGKLKIYTYNIVFTTSDIKHEITFQFQLIYKVKYIFGPLVLSSEIVLLKIKSVE